MAWRTPVRSGRRSVEDHLALARWRQHTGGRAVIVVRCGKPGALRLGFTITRSPESPLPGKKVDTGGYSLYIDCAGSGSRSGSDRRRQHPERHPSPGLRADGAPQLRRTLRVRESAVAAELKV
jgi:hypothetical protein